MESPRIRPDHVTADEFRAVIKRVGRGCSQIWLDIACINQEDDRVKLDEIGHQAAVSQGAKDVLSRCPIKSQLPLEAQMRDDLLMNSEG